MLELIHVQEEKRMRHYLLFIFLAFIISLNGCNPQRALWDKYENQVQTLDLSENRELPLTELIKNLRKIKSENPNAEFEGRSVDEIIEDWEVTLENVKAYKVLKKEQDDYIREVEQLSIGY